MELLMNAFPLYGHLAKNFPKTLSVNPKSIYQISAKAIYFKLTT